MDLSTFQLVDAINDMDMLRSLSGQDHYNKQHPQPQQPAYQQLQGDIDLLFESDQQANDQYMNQIENFNNSNHMDFSPLSSPAIMPHVDQNGYQREPIYQQQQYVATEQGDYEHLSANQICQEYEQLEQAKLLITQKLSELQKTPSSVMSSSTAYASIHSTTMLENSQLSTPDSSSQSPHMVPATPASLMNMKLPNAQPSKLQISPSSGNTQQLYTGSAIATPNSFASSASSSSGNPTFRSPILTTTPSCDSIVSPVMTPPTSKTSSKSKAPPPPSPLASKSRRRSSSNPNHNTAREKSMRTSSKKQRRESSSADQAKSSSMIHASPRALKPLLISPTLNPGSKPLPTTLVPISNSNNRVSSVEDVEHILATRSNYQNLMEGKGAALGIAFSTQIKSGLEVRRTAHKAAEQKRRDSLKECFDRLRLEVEDGYVKRQKKLISRVMKEQQLEKNASKKQKKSGEDEDMAESAQEGSNDLKPLSKVLLLQYAYEYINSLKSSLRDRDATIELLKQGRNIDNQDGNNDHTTDLSIELLGDEASTASSSSSSSAANNDLTMGE
ncbi:hypothetical protein [Parasitella parasitica]|uniref:BHLH domain-containing protein n=1 Tax=Parasitella parasitica TaxID=35722 RepID=A0A0B7NTP8_9FUNG|nr:hypothetical protein [Parasitella parasitica]